MNEIKFEGESPFVRTMRMHRNFRFEIDVVAGQPSQIEKVAQLMSLPQLDAVYEVVIRVKE